MQDLDENVQQDERDGDDHHDALDQVLGEAVGPHVDQLHGEVGVAGGAAGRLAAKEAQEPSDSSARDSASYAAMR